MVGSEVYASGHVCATQMQRVLVRRQDRRVQIFANSRSDAIGNLGSREQNW